MPGERRFVAKALASRLVFCKLDRAHRPHALHLANQRMDTSNGFGVSADCLANSQANGGLGFECKGANRQDVALDLLFYPTQQITVKVEYRHDWANNKVFLRNDGSYSKSNDLLATQFIYSF